MSKMKDTSRAPATDASHYWFAVGGFLFGVFYTLFVIVLTILCQKLNTL